MKYPPSLGGYFFYYYFVRLTMNLARQRLQTT